MRRRFVWHVITGPSPATQLRRGACSYWRKFIVATILPASPELVAVSPLPQVLASGPAAGWLPPSARFYSACSSARVFSKPPVPTTRGPCWRQRAGGLQVYVLCWPSRRSIGNSDCDGCGRRPENEKSCIDWLQKTPQI